VVFFTAVNTVSTYCHRTLSARTRRWSQIRWAVGQLDPTRQWVYGAPTAIGLRKLALRRKMLSQRFGVRDRLENVDEKVYRFG